MRNVTRFICFIHDLLHSIPKSVEIEAKETGLQGKNSHNSFKVGPTKSNNTYRLQELSTRQSYSGHIFFKVTFQGKVFL